jgi:hypothetical protein
MSEALFTASATLVSLNGRLMQGRQAKILVGSETTVVTKKTPSFCQCTSTVLLMTRVYAIYCDLKGSCLVHVIYNLSVLHRVSFSHTPPISLLLS